MRFALGSLIVAMLLAGQDDAEIRKQIALISDGNPRASFDAISRLADLAATRKGEVEKAIDALPDALGFYRNAAREELRVRDALGSTYPPLTRFSFEWTKAPVPEAIAELNRAAGTRGPWLELMQDLKREISAGLQNATLMEGLDAFLRNVDFHGLISGDRIKVWPGVGNGFDRCPFQHFLIDLYSLRIERKVEFGAPASHEFHMLIMLWWEPGLDIVQVTPADDVEVLDDRKRPIRGGPAQSDGRVANVAVSRLGHHAAYRFSLPAADATSISRLRGTLRVSHPKTKVVMDLTKTVKDAGPIEGDLVSVRLARETQYPEVRIKPKMALDKFAKMPILIHTKLKDGSEWSLVTEGTASAGEVAYHLILYGPKGPRVPKIDEIESLNLTLHTELSERLVSFDFRDIPLR